MSRGDEAAGARRSGAVALGRVRQPAFMVIWTASTVSNIGIAMFDTATGWFMANMSQRPDGGLAHPDRDQPAAVPVHHSRRRADRSRRCAAAAARRQSSRSSRSRRCSPALVSFGLASPELLLGATFLLGVGGALAAPAWVSIAPLLVPRRDLESATAANTAGYNISRARRAGDRRPRHRLGRHFGAVLDLCRRATSRVLAALLWWRPPRRVTSEPAGRAADHGDPHRRAPRPQQSPPARDAGAHARVLPVRQRLLGAAAAHRARAAGARRGVLRPAARRHRRRRDPRLGGAEPAARPGSGRTGWSRWRASARRSRWRCSALARDPVSALSAACVLAGRDVDADRSRRSMSRRRSRCPIGCAGAAWRSS